MKEYKLEITLLSPALIGSGERFGTLIDTDIVFDELGIPYIPSKRIKGCLRDSAIEVCEMLKYSNINNFINLSSYDTFLKTDKRFFQLVVSIFGEPGQSKSAPVYFSNLYIENYEIIKNWLEYLAIEYPFVFTREAVIDNFTEIRQQTAIEEEGSRKGIAKEHSLRTIRVAKKNLKFYGSVIFEKDEKDIIKLFSLACLNFRNFGTKRNRGFGEIECKLFDNSQEISFLNELEEIICAQLKQ